MKRDWLRNALFVVNPMAGNLPLRYKQKFIRHILQDTDIEIAVATSKLEAGDLSYEAMSKGQLVVACGGDGLQNIVAHQAVETGGIMSVLPLGRGNDFAMSIGITRPEDVIEVLHSGRVLDTRYLSVKFEDYQRICLTCAGVGLLSEAASRASAIPILKGGLLYAVAALASFVKLKNHHYQIYCDGKEIEDRYLIIAGAASPYTGGGMFIAPDAFKKSGMVNMLYAGKVCRREAIRLLLKVFSGAHLDHPVVTNRHFGEIILDTPSDNRLARLVYGDGEYLGNLPVRLTIGSKPLRVLVP